MVVLYSFHVKTYVSFSDMTTDEKQVEDVLGAAKSDADIAAEATSKTAKEEEKKVSEAASEGEKVDDEKAAQEEAAMKQAEAEAKAKAEQGTRLYSSLYSFYLTTRHIATASFPRPN